MNEQWIKEVLDIHDEILNKKDIRILFNCRSDNEGKINDLIVVEFTEKHDPQHLYKRYSYDTGNCLSDWDKWPIWQEILWLVDFYGFVDKPTKIKAFGQFLKIKEIRHDIAFYLYRLGSGEKSFQELIRMYSD